MPTQEELQAMWDSADEPAVSNQEDLQALWDSADKPPQSSGGGFEDFMKGLNRSKEEIFRSGARALNEIGIGGYTDERLQQDRSQDLRGDSGWDTAGKFTGDVLATATPSAKIFKGALALPKAIPKVLKLGGAGAVTGAGSSAMTGGDATDIEQAAYLGGTLGPVIPAVGKVGMKTYDLAKSRLAGPSQQVARALRESLGDRLPGAINAIKNLEASVPGEKLLTSRAAIADDMSYPELKALGLRAKAGGGTAYQTRNAELNRQARDQVLGNITRKGESLGVDPVTNKNIPSIAQGSRTLETQPMIQKIENEMVPISEELEQVMAGPKAVQALTESGKKLTQSQLNAQGLGDEVVEGFIPATRNAEGIVIDPAQRSVRNLQTVKGELGERLKRVTDNEDIQLITGALRQIDDTLMSVPGYGPYKEAYRIASQPQNQADVASILRGKLNTNVGNETAESFLKQLDDVPKLLKDAKLPSNYQTLEGVYASSPDDLNAIRGLADSVKREAQFNKMSTSMGAMRKPQSAAMSIESAMPTFLTKAATAFRRGLQRVGDASEDQINEVMIRINNSPDEAVKLLETVPPELRNPLVNLIRERWPEMTGTLIGSTQREE